jgi:hypothetical protein
VSALDDVTAPAPPPLVGLTHAEVLELEFEGQRFLIEDLVEPGVIFTTSGVPETFKSWINARIAIGVAVGHGDILGCSVVEQGNVGYVWQDDSTRNEAGRIQLLHRTLNLSTDLPIRWLLNEGVLLPEDIGRLREWVEQHELKLLALDSLYNFLSADPKDTEIGVIYKRLKAELVDPTGCTVSIVDHMPWATESNRKRLRSYGDVFKGAAARAGIYIDAEGSKLWVEARGNNIVGFKRTPAYWDANKLELRLVDAVQVNESERRARILQWVKDNPGNSTTKLLEGVGGNHDTTRKLLRELEKADDVTSNRPSGRDDDKAPTYWYPRNHAGLHVVRDMQTTLDDRASELSQGTPIVQSSESLKGTIGGTADTNGATDTGPSIGDNGYLELLFAAFSAGHVTEGEWRHASKAHQQLVVRQGAA